MAFTLPDGSKVLIGTALGSAINVSAITNANPAVATATGHGLANGDEILFVSGWEDANENIFRVGGSATNSFNMEGLDSSATNWYPAGSGVGTVQKVTTWQEIQQITNIQASGGDPQYATVELLSRRNATNIPTRFNATTLTLTLADDPTLAGYQALVTASRGLLKRAFKFVLTGGSVGYGYGYVALNEMPAMNKGQVNTVQASITLLGKYIRFSS